MSEGGDPNLYAYMMLWEEELVLDGEEVEGEQRRRALSWHHRRGRKRVMRDRR